MLSTRYGKIEDLLLSLRVALAGGELIDTVSVPRHAVGPELTQLFVGSEGTLGIITRATLEIVPLPAERRFMTLALPGRRGRRRAPSAARCTRAPPVGDPHVRRGGDRRTLSPVVGEPLDGVCAVVCFEGEPAAVAAEGARTVELAREEGARELDPALAQRWWDRRYDFYKPPHHPELPSIWGTIDVVASYTRIAAVHRGAADRRPRALRARRASSCACTSRTGTAGAR